MSERFADVTFAGRAIAVDPIVHHVSPRRERFCWYGKPSLSGVIDMCRIYCGPYPHRTVSRHRLGTVGGRAFGRADVREIRSVDHQRRADGRKP